MKEIALTRGRVALIDDEDYERINRFKWHLSIQGGGDNLYACRWIRPERRGPQVKILLHRFLLHAPPGVFVDHIDGDGLNNQKCNLRQCSSIENQRNRRKRGEFSSRFKGVWWERKQRRWRAAIRHLGKLIHLGAFENEEDAAKAYNIAAASMFGDFSNLNEIGHGNKIGPKENKASA